MSQLLPGVTPQLLHRIQVIQTCKSQNVSTRAMYKSFYSKQKRCRLNLPKFSSSCFVLDSWVRDRKHDSSSDIVHIPVTAEGDTKSTYTTVEKYRSAQKLNKTNTFEFLFFLPHTWQNLQRRQHQFSLFSSDGRSAGSRQKRWKGSQHTWQCSICKNQHIKIIHLSVNTTIL